MKSPVIKPLISLSSPNLTLPTYLMVSVCLFLKMVLLFTFSCSNLSINILITSNNISTKLLYIFNVNKWRKEVTSSKYFINRLPFSQVTKMVHNQNNTRAHCMTIWASLWVTTASINCRFGLWHPPCMYSHFTIMARHSCSSFALTVCLGAWRPL